MDVLMMTIIAMKKMNVFFNHNYSYLICCCAGYCVVYNHNPCGVLVAFFLES